MTLKDYKISFPYGATSWPYSIFKPHHGEDRAAPKGTIVTVGKLKIGTVGSTGFSTGPHTHIDMHKGINPLAGIHYKNPKYWVNMRGTVVWTGWLGTAGKTVIIKSNAGNYYRFLHLDKIVTSKGKKTY